jgi:hypothetical protein
MKSGNIQKELHDGRLFKSTGCRNQSAKYIRHTSFGLLLMHKPAYGFQFGEAAVERNARNCVGDFFGAYNILS